jgi:hypothetical protein
MTRETYRFRNGDVRPDHDLRVAGSAPQLLSPSHFVEVHGVVEDDPFPILSHTLQKALLVAPLAQARFVRDLGPEPRTVRTREILHYLGNGAELTLDVAR